MFSLPLPPIFSLSFCLLSLLILFPSTSYILYGFVLTICVYIGGMDDNKLEQLVHTLPRNSVLVLEDIDSIFVKRKASVTSPVQVSFSGLLNALDGIATTNGRILFMTTNHIDRLSPALIRPGRIDRKFFFDYASHDQIETMYRQFYPDASLAILGEIIAKIGEVKITTAQLQGWFILNNERPEDLSDDVERFIGEAVRENSKSDEVPVEPDAEGTEENKDNKDSKEDKD